MEAVSSAEIFIPPPPYGVSNTFTDIYIEYVGAPITNELANYGRSTFRDSFGYTIEEYNYIKKILLKSMDIMFIPTVGTYIAGSMGVCSLFLEYKFFSTQPQIYANVNLSPTPTMNKHTMPIHSTDCAFASLELIEKHLFCKLKFEQATQPRADVGVILQETRKCLLGMLMELYAESGYKSIILSAKIRCENSKENIEWEPILKKIYNLWVKTIANGLGDDINVLEYFRPSLLES